MRSNRVFRCLILNHTSFLLLYRRTDSHPWCASSILPAVARFRLNLITESKRRFQYNCLHVVYRVLYWSVNNHSFREEIQVEGGRCRSWNSVGVNNLILDPILSFLDVGLLTVELPCFVCGPDLDSWWCSAVAVTSCAEFRRGQRRNIHRLHVAVLCILCRRSLGDLNSRSAWHVLDVSRTTSHSGPLRPHLQSRRMSLKELGPSRPPRREC